LIEAKRFVILFLRDFAVYEHVVECQFHPVDSALQIFFAPKGIVIVGALHHAGDVSGLRQVQIFGIHVEKTTGRRLDTV
jgi:hypothetical protein